MMHSAVCTILCWVLQSEMLQFPNQTVMQLARTLSVVPVEHGEDGWRDVRLLQAPEEVQTLLGTLVLFQMCFPMFSTV
ncbi:hypothetical protein PGIGA_G00233470 [Pangasianodon gigas]|uniref:Uncharacterized protein n=1 Tax=Pangasianodon gigas TaxID=30993 RepID=A0ACC5WLX2_PANGG|nr:hypothetical protein [Pangasianodon gigas]